MFEVTSWNGASPMNFAIYSEARDAAIARARREGTTCHLLDIKLEESQEFHSDGHIGKWHDCAKPTAKQKLGDVMDAIEDQRA